MGDVSNVALVNLGGLFSHVLIYIRTLSGISIMSLYFFFCGPSRSDVPLSDFVLRFFGTMVFNALLLILTTTS